MAQVTLRVRTQQRSGLEDITGRVQQAVREAGVREGTCVVYVPHTTAGLVVNENYDPTVVADILSTLDHLVPQQGPYRHAEGNSPAHIKACLVGPSHTFLVADGHVVLGTWQGIFMAEFDGPRERRVLVGVQ